MFSNSKAKKILCGCAAFSMLGPDAGCAKSNNTSVSIQKSKSTTHSAVSKTKSRVQNDELDDDFEYSDNNNDTNTATLKAILPSIDSLKKYTPYTLAALPSLGIVTYGSIKKLLESENPLSPAPTPPEPEPTPTPIPTPGPTPTPTPPQDEKENTSILKVVILSMVVFGIILVIYIYCKCNSKKRSSVATNLEIKYLRGSDEFVNDCNNTDTHFNNANSVAKFGQMLTKNNNAEDAYIKLSVGNGTIGHIKWQANNCFIISAICTRFGMERKEPSNVLLNYNLTPMQVAYFLLKMIEKRREVEGEGERLIWTESKKELNDLLKPENREKLKRFATRMMYVLFYDYIAWEPFMKKPNEQYEEENKLFGHKVDGSTLSNFRKAREQGNPVDALDGMGVSYVGGGSGFEYKGQNGDVIKPETSIPFTQILDQNSMYMRITYDGAKEKFILQDYTWNENNPVQKELSYDEILSGAISFDEGWYIEKDETRPGTMTEEQLNAIEGYIIREYNCNWYVYPHGDKTSQCSFFHMVDNKICLLQNGKVTELSEEDYKEKLQNEFSIVEVKERSGNDEELQVYGEDGKCIRSFANLDAYKRECNENVRKNHKLIKYGERNIRVKYKEKFEFPAHIKNRKMYIAAVGYTIGNHDSGHCQAYEFKYDKQKNCKEGEAKYTTKDCIDRSCYSPPDKVTKSKNAYNYLQGFLSRKGGINKNIASNFGSVRLIPEQVIDEFPVQYRYYESKEELDVLKEEISRNNENSVENEDIRMINEILRELKEKNNDDEIKDLFKDVNLLGDTSNEDQGENHNNSDSLKNIFNLLSNSNDNNG